MSELFSLQYFDAIFEKKSPAYRELLETMALMCQEYAQDYRQTVLARDEAAFGAVRHKNVTLIENLELHGLKALQLQAKAALAQGESDEVLALNVNEFTKNILEVRQALLQVIERDFPAL